ncbi:hypothetical protein RRG08_012134 [Elysia crispata]|uniref:Uncharacterized protein n=1 Tax=Elysia crispata TaxID=231223 RepID=A0AAE1E0N2_9GAST|nr:hypothetical protein RRG08_012134 [Elysia crispata]
MTNTPAEVTRCQEKMETSSPGVFTGRGNNPQAILTGNDGPLRLEKSRCLGCTRFSRILLFTAEGLWENVFTVELTEMCAVRDDLSIPVVPPISAIPHHSPLILTNLHHAPPLSTDPHHSPPISTMPHHSPLIPTTLHQSPPCPTTLH